MGLADRKRILVIGHSVLNPRQAGLWKALADLGHRVHAVGPARWADEVNEPESHGPTAAGGTFQSHPLEGHGTSFMAWRPHGLGSLLRVLRGIDAFLVIQEGWCQCAQVAIRQASDRGIPAALFSWENRDELPEAWGPGFAEAERSVLTNPALKVAIGGNEEAAKRLLKRGARASVVCPQTGVDTTRFKPDPTAEKRTFALYAGRFVADKGLGLIEDACRDLRLPLLLHGGRGDYEPKGWAKTEPWGDWGALPGVFNAAEVHVSHPTSQFTGYREQFGYAYAEAMASGLPALASTNGSIPTAFGGSPLMLAKEGDASQVKDLLHALAKSPSSRRDIGQKGRKWVIENLSLPVIARRYDAILEDVIRGEAPPTAGTGSAVAVAEAGDGEEREVGPSGSD